MKKYLPDLIVILAFVIISIAYFFPAVIEGRTLFHHDTVAGAGAGHEAKEYYERTGERTRWTNSLFGGMPTYQISPSYDSTNTLRSVEKAYHLFLPGSAWLVFIMMLGFFILLRAFGVSAWLSAIGGIFWGFSSYFFILIFAGHLWKFITLAYIPPTIAGIVLAYRGKYLAGGLLAALFAALQVLSNHVQMTYYFLFVILFMVIAYFVEAYKSKTLPHFFKASGVLIIAALVGVAINLPNLYHTYEYSKETMRGKNELVETGKSDQASGGLDKGYITAWSYGIGETFTLLVPNTKGGASIPLIKSKKAMEKGKPMYVDLYKQLTQYWGEQPGTQGPVYVGAFVLMLFVLGLFIVKGPMKWALLAATVFSILLSWGHNFMGFTDFFIDYVPFYNKFRAVSSILVIAEFTIPLLAILALKEVFDRPQILKEQRKYFYISLGLTAGLALLFAIAPRFFFSSYISSQEMAALQNGIPGNQLGQVLSNLEEMRIHLFTSDAWRSFFIIAIGCALLFAYTSKKLKGAYVLAGIAILCLVDMWGVNKRYLNDEKFKPAKVKTETFSQTSSDKFILQDESKDYRVLNLASNTFNENNTSYWHKSVGGYHAAKLLRYQQMIERHISKEIQTIYSEVSKAGGDMELVNPASFRVLNMLNTKYFIFAAGKEGETFPLENPHAYGNAWFVDNIKYVDNANEEIDALNTIQPLETAVVDVRFKEALKGATESYKDSLSSITLKSYEPNQLVYETNSAKDAIAVFSEIYYPGWKVTIDGQPAEIGRADYILRAVNIPAGKHTVEMTFKPTSLKVTETIAYIGLGLLLVGVIVLLVRVRKSVVPHNK
ncbi:YfhO family protein [Bacteroides sp. 224]|uniref:YfhO family protein n=1 Tax=Bacteroides sp. 224 TaxID=2302936 RepID=UPI0013D17A97|nr:YfhO family protein [Bacteroides sp. 224]NDV63686.1 hypothetical protein [Bacteroides sp. 224]